MASLSRAGNYLRYMRSNWMTVAGSFLLLLMVTVVGMSFLRLGDANAEYYDGYNNAYNGANYATYNNYKNNDYSPYVATSSNPSNRVSTPTCREGMYYNETSRSCLTITQNPPTCRTGMYYNETTRSCLTKPQTANNNNNYQHANSQPSCQTRGDCSNANRAQPARNDYRTNEYGNNNNRNCQNYCNSNGYYGTGSGNYGGYYGAGGGNYGMGGTYQNPSQYPGSSYYPQPSPAYTPPVVENKNENNSPATATATANVVVNQALAPAPSKGVIASTVGYRSGKGGAVPSGMPIMLPETGTDNPALNLLGIGGLVAAGVAYTSSRRELATAIFKRN